MPIRLSFPNKGWAELRWSEEDELPEDFVRAATRLEELPGVDLREGYLRAPVNVWNLGPWALAQSYMDNQADAPDYSAPLWQPKRPLYEHQAEAASFIVRNGGALVADQMGLGKTAEAIVAAETIALTHDYTRPRVIIAPKYTRDVWRRELLAMGAIDSDDDFAYAEGRSTTDPDFNFDARWWFVHYDIISFWSNRLVISPRGVEGRPLVAILDEVHWCKNGRAKRSKGAMNLAGTAMFRILLTGTPVANRPSELWWPLSILDGPRSWGSPIDFRVRYCGAIHDGYGYQDQGPTHMDELKARLTTRYIRREIGDAGIELPPLTRQSLTVDMELRERRAHDGLIDKLGGYEGVLRAVMARSAGEETLLDITKLRTVTSEAKLRTTVDFCVDLVEQGESVVVFTWTRATAVRIHKKLEHEWWASQEDDPRICVFAHGGIVQEDRDTVINMFQERGGVLVATLGALKEGVTLHKARYVVMHDLDWVPSNILQAEARVYRIGQTRPTISTWVLATDSIDQLLAQCLIHKGQEIRQTVGIGAAEQAAEQLGLQQLAGIPTVADEVERMFATWEVRDG